MQTVMTCPSGRFVLCDFTVLGHEWRVINVYAPNKPDERRLFFENAYQHFQCDRLIIFLGDFNCVCRAVDRSSSVRYNDASILALNDITEDFVLEDVACCAPSAKAVSYTHFQGDSHARLDRVYISSDLVSLCSNYSVDYVSFSDHCLVSFG